MLAMIASGQEPFELIFDNNKCFIDNLSSYSFHPNKINIKFFDSNSFYKIIGRQILIQQSKDIFNSLINLETGNTLYSPLFVVLHKTYKFVDCFFINVDFGTLGCASNYPEISLDIWYEEIKSV